GAPSPADGRRRGKEEISCLLPPVWGRLGGGVAVFADGECQGFFISTFLLSHATSQAASSRLFLSCISMCELPWMPISGSTTSSVLPPSFFIASAYSRHCLSRGAQRGDRST